MAHNLHVQIVCLSLWLPFQDRWAWKRYFWYPPFRRWRLSLLWRVVSKYQPFEVALIKLKRLSQQLSHPIMLYSSSEQWCDSESAVLVPINDVPAYRRSYIYQSLSCGRAFLFLQKWCLASKPPALNCITFLEYCGLSIVESGKALNVLEFVKLSRSALIYTGSGLPACLRRMLGSE